MNRFASFFTDKGVVLLEHRSTTSISYRLVVEQRGERMVVVKVGGGREELLVERLDVESLAEIRRDHLAHEEDPLAAGAEILLHHTIEEVVACLDGEYWAVERAIARISKAGDVDWRARHLAMLNLWEASGEGVAESRSERTRRVMIDRGIRRMLELDLPAPWAIRLAAARWRRLILGTFDDQRIQADLACARSRAAHAARVVIEREAAASGIELSRMLTLGLVEHIVAGRVNLGTALRLAREATFDQLLGYEPI